MAPPKLSNANQPLWVRSLLRLYEFFASLKLAVILIFSVAVVLGGATFVESNWGTAAAKWYVYHSHWYLVLMGLLALNIFCAASIRYPWKRHQTGFVITHIGLLTLLAGSAVSFRGSLNSQMLVYLNGSSQVALDHDEGFVVFEDLPGHPEPLRVRFHPGPFHWQDLRPSGWQRAIKSWVGLDDTSKSWEHPPQVVYEKDDVRVEIADFYSRSEVRDLPYLRLLFKNPAFKVEMPVDLEFNSDLHYAESDFGGMGRVMFWRTDRADDLTAFQECIPERSAEGDGALVIWSRGERHQLSIGMLKDKKEAVPLNDDVSVQLTAYAPWADMNQLVKGKGLVSRGNEPNMPAVELIVREKINGEVREHRLVRFAEFPFMPYGSRPEKFLVEFYHPAVKGRVDILEGPEHKLAYRVWQQKLGRVIATGELRPGEAVESWSTGGRTEGGPPMIWMMTLEKYIAPQEANESFRVLPLPFDKDNRGESKRVKVRVSWRDGETRQPKVEEFWLRQNMPAPWQNPKSRQIHETATASGTIHSSYHVKETDVGWTAKLVDFDLDVDPGTTMAMNYTSHIIQVDVRDKPEIVALRERMENASDPLEKQRRREELAAKTQELTDGYLQQLEKADAAARDKLLASDEALSSRVITMNDPLDYADWRGRTLRFFQENYLKPDPEQGSSLGSIFRVNYDPGRGIKYLGSLLITAGIFTMFYMRAYFFKNQSTPTAQRVTKSPAEREKIVAGSPVTRPNARV